jgi:2-polyprenyl-3-methyl-5-hydroxy-6-metoxy-1,4-benzoquinol methylase
MTTTESPTTVSADPGADLEARAAELNGRLFMACIGTLELATVALGDRLGLYRTLADLGTATPAQLADAAGIAPRYAREWLEQQAVAGIVEVASEGDEDSRRYALPAAHAPVLLDPDSLLAGGPLAAFVPIIGGAFDLIVDAFRTGGGVPYAAYDIHDAQAGFTRPMFVNLLTSEWIPAIPELHARLQASPPARVVEIGCGEGVAAVAIAQAYPGVQVDGFDLDEASIEVARRHAADAGVADRVTFEVRDVTDGSVTGTYDAAFAFEMIHDLARPVAALQAMRILTAGGGVCIVADEKVDDEFAAPGDELHRFMYSASVVHCLPVGMTEQPSAGTGTVIRPSTLRRYAVEAGFGGAEILPIENDFWRFYRLA